MKYVVSGLEGALLDAAVAKAEGFPYALFRTLPDHPGPHQCVLLSKITIFSPSSSWADAGPIIERERIAIVACGNTWDAAVDGFVDTGFGISSHTGEAIDAPTALVAAMRAFVAAKLGAEVDLQTGAQQRASGDAFDAFAAAFPNIRLAKTSP